MENQCTACPNLAESLMTLVTYCTPDGGDMVAGSVEIPYLDGVVLALKAIGE